jgi:hypothetical protein
MTQFQTFHVVEFVVVSSVSTLVLLVMIDNEMVAKILPYLKLRPE